MAGVTGTSLINKFNVGSNDNKASTWGNTWTTRKVLGPGESRKIVAQIRKLPAAEQKTALRSIAGQVDKSKGDRGLIGKVYITPEGQAVFKKLAQKLGVSVSFAGNPNAPRVMG